MIRLRRSAILPRHRNKPRPEWKVAEAFKQWIRGRDCACGGRNPNCGGDIQSAHVDYAGKGTRDAKGMGSKAADRFCIPLSMNCHRLQHDKGWPWFETNVLKARAEDLSGDYWFLWPARRQWESKNGDAA